MLNDPFWTAVRLVEFANLEITPKNWRSLWAVGDLAQFFRHLLLSPDPTVIGDDGVLVPGLEPDSRGGELWSALLTGLKRWGTVPAPTYDDIRQRIEWLDSRLRRTDDVAAPVQDWLLQADEGGLYGARAHFVLRGYPMASWPRRATDGRRRPTRIGFTNLVRLHERTRADLHAIVVDDRERLPEVIERLRQAYVGPPRRFGRSHLDVYRTDTPFQVYEENDAAETLDQHLVRLFVDTAVAGLWPRFFECENRNCRRFGISRRGSQRQRRTCPDSSRCRVAVKRSRDEAKGRGRRVTSPSFADV